MSDKNTIVFSCSCYWGKFLSPVFVLRIIMKTFVDLRMRTAVLKCRNKLPSGCTNLSSTITFQSISGWITSHNLQMSLKRKVLWVDFYLISPWNVGRGGGSTWNMSGCHTDKPKWLMNPAERLYGNRVGGKNGALLLLFSDIRCRGGI